MTENQKSPPPVTEAYLSAMIDTSQDLMAALDGQYCLVLANRAFHGFIERLNGHPVKPGDNILKPVAHEPRQLWKQVFLSAS